MAPVRTLQTKTQLIEGFNAEFAKLYSHWVALVKSCQLEFFYQQVNLADGSLIPPLGERLLRSAAVVEQTCGGLTANLWDDPFEWTLPETLTTRQRILEYLDEVEITRQRAFSSLLSDSDLLKVISTPSGEVQTLASLLLDTLARAYQLQGQASLTAEILSAQNTRGCIT